MVSARKRAFLEEIRCRTKREFAGVRFQPGGGLNGKKVIDSQHGVASRCSSYACLQDGEIPRFDRLLLFYKIHKIDASFLVNAKLSRGARWRGFGLGEGAEGDGKLAPALHWWQAQRKAINL